MKKIIGLLILASVLLTLGFVSADVPICATYETTMVSGTVTDATNGNVAVAGADVTVDCNGNKEYATTDSNGGYAVQFTESECGYEDDVKVTASYSTLTGENETVAWYTENKQVGCLELIVNVACGNVPLVPEFGTVIGIVTALGALGVFFIVRRK